jgi:Fe-S cluster assembly protein SufD
MSSAAFLEALGMSPVAGVLAEVRARGRAAFAESGFPSRRSEAWRFTDLKPLVEGRFGAATEPVAPESLDRLIAESPVRARLVFVNGRLDAARSTIPALPTGCVGSFADWAAFNDGEAARLFDLGGGAERALLSLNAAFFTDGPVVVLPDGGSLGEPLHVFHWNDCAAPAAVHERSLIRLGAGAEATILETFCGLGPGWSNAATTIELGAGARLRHYTLQDGASDAIVTAHLAATIGEGAEFDGFLLSLGGRLARQDVRAVLAGSRAFCGYSGAYLLAGRQESSVVSLIDHAAPQGRSRQVFKGCLSDRSHGVFQGKILVRPDAQKTDGYQLNKTMLLGDRAVMDSKPELEIHADDVKCSHGATIGDLDETALFYLRSRGIPAAEARQMLIEAFVLDAVDLVEDEAARLWLGAAIRNRLAAGKVVS